MIPMIPEMDPGNTYAWFLGWISTESDVVRSKIASLEVDITIITTSRECRGHSFPRPNKPETEQLKT